MCYLESKDSRLRETYFRNNFQKMLYAFTNKNYALVVVKQIITH